MIVQNTIPEEKLDEASNNDTTTKLTVYENAASGQDLKTAAAGDVKDKRITGKKTVEEVVNEIVGKPTMWLVLFFMVVMSYGYSVDSLTYLTVFAGVVQYNKWECISPKCNELLASSTNKEDFYSRKTLCDSNLKMDVDFVFTNDNRTSFAVEWGLFCDGEAKMSFLSSIIFAGAYVGFLLASPLFDTLGRKKVTIASALLTLVTTIACGFSPNYYMMDVLRFLCGLGKNACWTGIYCWMLEFTPSDMRTFMTILSNTLHGVGYLLVDLVGYKVKNWRHIFFIISAVTFMGTVPMFFVPESPRFLLTKGKLAKAKASLEKFSRLIRSPQSMAEVDFVFTSHKQNWLKQIKDFYIYPKLGRQTILFALMWMIACSLSYTFNFGWSKISKDFYMGYVYAGIGIIVSFLLIMPATKMLGKKRGMLLFLVSSFLSYCIAMIDYNISPSFTVEHLASLLGYMSILGSYVMIYQYTGELTPTSHRGMVYCICGSFGRIGSFLGPYSQLIFTILDRKITFGIFAGVSLICILIICYTRDPTGRAMPETPKDLE